MEEQEETTEIIGNEAVQNDDGTETAKRQIPVKPIAAVCGMVVCLVFGGFVGYGAGAGSMNDDLAAVQKKLDTVQQTSKSYQEAATTLQDKLKLYSQVDDAQSQLDDINSQIESQQAQLDALTGQVDAAKKNTVTTGVWQVGKDIPAGTYRATTAVPSDCYWSIEVNGDIVDNDLPGGGFPQVTVSDGQQLKLQGCGVWSKQ